MTRQNGMTEKKERKTDRQTDQQNRRGTQIHTPIASTTWFLTKMSKNIYLGKRHPLQQMVLVKWISTCRRKRFDPYL